MTPQEEREFKRKIDEIHLCVAGNDQYGQKGIKHVIEDHSKRLDKLEEYKRKDWKRLAVAASGSGAIGGALGILFPKTVLGKVAAFVANIFT